MADSGPLRSISRTLEWLEELYFRLARENSLALEHYLSITSCQGMYEWSMRTSQLPYIEAFAKTS